MFVESVIILNEAFERLLAAVGVWGVSRYIVGLLWAEPGGEEEGDGGRVKGRGRGGEIEGRRESEG